ncbi:hypothetical protein Tco_0274281, partial [Tanacetum coccineum]
RNVSFTGNIAPRRASSEAWDAGDRHRPVFTGIVPWSAQDEVSEALLSQFFHEFLQSGVVTGTLDKLKKSGAFERDGETNVFARLLDKQQKHQKFLQFLALSKCHEELSSRQSMITDYYDFVPLIFYCHIILC